MRIGGGKVSMVPSSAVDHGLSHDHVKVKTVKVASPLSTQY